MNEQEEKNEGSTAEQYIRMTRVLTMIESYVSQCTEKSLKVRAAAMEQDNTIMFAYHQCALDVCRDLSELLGGRDLHIKKERPAQSMMHQ